MMNMLGYPTSLDVIPGPPWFMIGAWICTAPAARAAVDSSAATTAKGQDWETTECAHVNQTFIFTLIAVSQ